MFNLQDKSTTFINKEQIKLAYYCLFCYVIKKMIRNELKIYDSDTKISTLNKITN